MRAFNNSQNNTTSDNRSTSACSYCRDESHQISDCPHAKSDWAYFQNFQIPCSDPDNWTNNPVQSSGNQRSWNQQTSQARWFKEPHGWSKWYAQCSIAVEKIEKAEKRKANKKNKVRKASKCGFCGSVHHNRRACPSMDALNERLIRANAHWRKRFYDRVVSDMGLGIGALIKVSEQVGAWGQQETVEHVGIVTSINFDDVNMFSYTESAKRNWRNRLDHRFQAPFIIKANVNGVEKNVTLTNQRHTNGQPFKDEHGRPLADVFTDSYRSVLFVSVVSPTEQPLSDDWVSGGQQECVEFITKKYSKQVLTDKYVIELLENYEKRFNL
jgi:ribosomal protein L32